MKKLIMIRPPLFCEPGNGRIRLTKLGERRMNLFLGIVSQHFSKGTTAVLCSKKETAKETARIIAKSIGLGDPTVIGELISGDFNYFITEVVHREVLKTAKKLQADTLVVITGKELCYDLPVYWANAEFGDSNFIKKTFPQQMPKGGIGIVDLVLKTASVDTNIYS